MADILLATFGIADGSADGYTSDSGHAFPASGNLYVWNGALRATSFTYEQVAGVDLGANDLDIKFDALWGGATTANLAFMLSSDGTIDGGLYFDLGYSGTISDIAINAYWQTTGSKIIDNVVAYSGGFPSDNTLVPVRVTIVGTALTVYVNGAQVATATLTGFDSTNLGLYFRGNSSDGATTIKYDNFNLDTYEPNQKPTIILTGSASINHEAGTPYTDAGATANDTEDGNITGDIVVTGTIDTSTLGPQTLDFDVTDSGGAAADTVTRTVTVVDTTAPVITLVGDAIINLVVGQAYTEQGANWSDFVDGTGAATVGGDTVDVNTAGTYTVTYNQTDAAGNVATEVTRTVNVAVETSTLNLSFPNTADGNYKVRLFDQFDTHIFTGIVAFASNDASITGLPVAAGSDLEGVAFDNENPHVDGVPITGTTV